MSAQFNPAPPPDWVMLGAPLPSGGVVIYASRELTRAELEVEYDWHEKPGFGSYREVDPEQPPKLTATLTAVSRDVIRVVGPDYGAALRTLLEEWTPQGRSSSSALPGTPAALERGHRPNG